MAVCDLETEEFELLPDESRSKAIMRGLLALLHTLQSEQPVFIYLDDLHWADALSVEILDKLSNSLHGLQMIICCAARPEFRHNWVNRSCIQQITLRRLTDDESLSLIHEHSANSPLEPKQEQTIINRGEGNPFYIVEMVHMLKESGLSEIPSKIEEVILQRIDQLAKQERDVLEAASIIGREFSEKLLNNLPDITETESNIEKLRQHEMIYEKQIVPEIQYIFRHYYTHKATYNNILFDRRRELHKQVAKAIEIVYESNLERHYSVLAQHFEEAGDHKNALEYYRLAGQISHLTQSEKAASGFCRKAEEMIDIVYSVKMRKSFWGKMSCCFLFRNYSFFCLHAIFVIF